MTETSTMHPFRSHTCGALRSTDVGGHVRISGWVHRKRDHGNLLFVDLRDHYGITQCVIESEAEIFRQLETIRSESVLRIDGRVVAREPETVNPNLPTGEVEIRIEDMEVLSAAAELPIMRGRK